MYYFYICVGRFFIKFVFRDTGFLVKTSKRTRGGIKFYFQNRVQKSAEGYKLGFYYIDLLVIWSIIVLKNIENDQRENKVLLFIFKTMLRILPRFMYCVSFFCWRLIS